MDKTLKEIIHSITPPEQIDEVPRIPERFPQPKQMEAAPLNQVIFAIGAELDAFYKAANPFFGEKDNIGFTFEGPIVDNFELLYRGLYNSEAVYHFDRIFTRGGNKEDLKVESLQIKIPSSRKEKRELGSDMFLALQAIYNMHESDPSNLTAVSIHVNDSRATYTIGPYHGSCEYCIRFETDKTTVVGEAREGKRYCKVLFIN